jgi:hypothetical protein
VGIDAATRNLMVHFREAGMQRAAIGALLIVALLATLQLGVRAWEVEIRSALSGIA